MQEKHFIPLWTQWEEGELQLQIRILGFILFSASLPESHKPKTQLWSGNGMLFGEKRVLFEWFSSGDRAIWEIALYPKAEFEETQACICSLSPVGVAALRVWQQRSPSTSVPLLGGRRACHLARWHGPPANGLVPTSAPECGGWSARKTAQMTVAVTDGRGKRPSKKEWEALPHRFPCWSGPYCIRYNCFSCGPDAPVSLHSYSLQAKEGGWREMPRSKGADWFSVRQGEGVRRSQGEEVRRSSAACVAVRKEVRTAQQLLGC